MLAKTITPTLLTSALGLLACSTGDRDTASVNRSDASKRAVPCDTSVYGSRQFLDALPAVREAAGRSDLGEDPATRVTTAVLITPRGARLISTLSWGGPNGGVLLLMSCDGDLLRSAEVGYVLSLQSQDVTGDASSELIIEQQTGSGTGLAERQISVYGITGDTIAVLWSTVSFAASYQGEELGGSWESRASVTFPSRDHIEVRRERVNVHYDRASGRWKPTGPPQTTRESFVWDGKLGLFVPTQIALINRLEGRPSLA